MAWHALSPRPHQKKKNLWQGHFRIPFASQNLAPGKFAWLMRLSGNTDCMYWLTSDELLCHAEFCTRDAALRTREANLLQLEADLLRRKASLKRWEESQAMAERMAFMDPDGSTFWESLNDEPSDDESDLTTSISSSSTVTNPSTPPRHPPPTTLEPVDVGSDRVYEVSSPSMQGSTATWCALRLCPHF